MWRAFVTQLCPEATFGGPASRGDLAKCERDLDVVLPDELKSLYLECDGIHGVYEASLVWPLRRVVDENRRLRTDPELPSRYMSFDQLLMFGDAGNGDLFGVRMLVGAFRDTEVFSWGHEDDSRPWVAPSIRLYLEWLLTGRIKL